MLFERIRVCTSTIDDREKNERVTADRVRLVIRRRRRAGSVNVITMYT